MDPLARALRFSWAFSDGSADAVERIARGTVLRGPSLPHAWSINVVRLEGPHDDLDLAAVEALADAHQDTPYRHVHVEDERTALRLLEQADADERWATDREVLMALGATPGAPAVATRDGTLDEVLDLMRAWMRQEGQPEDVVEQLAQRSAREYAIGEQRHVVADHDGRAAAMCTVRLGGDVAQLEDVYVRPSARGAGFGRAVTAEGARIAAASGADLVFIVADDLDWPKQLYAKLGFSDLGRRAQLHRK